MKKQKKILIIAFFTLISLIGVVYAAFSVLTLKINTSASASASIFNVGFDNVAPTIEKSNDSITVNTTTPTDGDKTVTLSVNGLKAPGDTATIIYTIRNSGDIDASDIAPRVGPEIIGDSDWPTNFSSPGNTWKSDDGVFEFGAYPMYSPLEFPEDEYWSSNPNGSAPLAAGQKGIIRVVVKLLKRVDVDTNASCTMKLIAMPDSASIGE